MTQIGTALGALVLGILLVVIFGLLLSLPVMLLWNWALVGTVAGIGELTWLKAWGILVLCGFLFKSSSSSK